MSSQNKPLIENRKAVTIFKRICDTLGLTPGAHGTNAKIVDIIKHSGAEVSATAVGLWSKTQPPGIDNLLIISQISKVSVHWLLTGEGEQYVNPPIEKALENFIRRIAHEEIALERSRESNVRSLDTHLEQIQKRG